MEGDTLMTNQSNAELVKLMLEASSVLKFDGYAALAEKLQEAAEAQEHGLVPLPDENALTKWLFDHAVGCESHGDILALALAKKLIERFGTSTLVPLPDMPDEDFANTIISQIGSGNTASESVLIIWQSLRRFGTLPAPSADERVVEAEREIVKAAKAIYEYWRAILIGTDGKDRFAMPQVQAMFDAIDALRAARSTSQRVERRKRLVECVGTERRQSAQPGADDTLLNDLSDAMACAEHNHLINGAPAFDAMRTEFAKRHLIVSRAE